MTRRCAEAPSPAMHSPAVLPAGCAAALAPPFSFRSAFKRHSNASVDVQDPPEPTHFEAASDGGFFFHRAHPGTRGQRRLNIR